MPKGDGVEVIEADGKTVMPGLIDGHLHMGIFGESSGFYSMPIYRHCDEGCSMFKADFGNGVYHCKGWWRGMGLV